MKHSKKNIAILTPTFNRSKQLIVLHESLLKQVSKDFAWYIIDDGSTDDTEKVVDGFKNGPFPIHYLKKENGGKHTALNSGIKVIEEELVLIVDSDDYLVNDATHLIAEEWLKYKTIDGLCGMSFYKSYADGTITGKHFSQTAPFVSTFIEERVNKKVTGDKAEVWLSSVLKRYQFPVYPGEKFLSEAVVWNKISADGYKMVFIPETIYVCEYLDGGLTKSGRRIRLQCPMGTFDHALSYLLPQVRFHIKAKYCLYLSAVAAYSSNFGIVWHKLKSCKLLFLFLSPFGFLLSLFWKFKYGK